MPVVKPGVSDFTARATCGGVGFTGSVGESTGDGGGSTGAGEGPTNSGQCTTGARGVPWAEEAAALCLLDLGDGIELFWNGFSGLVKKCVW